jgi:hypothetical protein
LAALVHAVVERAFKTFLTGARRGVAEKAAYAGRCLAASVQVQS